MNLSAIHPFLKTKSEANDLIILLQKLQEGIFKKNSTMSTLLAETADFELKTALEKLFLEEKVGDNNKIELKSFILDLQKAINSLPRAHIIISRPITSEFLNTIHNWFYETYKQIVLLDISVDEKIIAGCVISFGGRAQDYSLAAQLEQMELPSI